MTLHPVNVVKQTVTVYTIRYKHEFVRFTVSEAPQLYTLAINSSYGDFLNTWTHPGTSFNSFLAGLNLGYVGGKMVHDEPEFDAEETRKALRTAVLETRREGDCTAEKAREEWDSIGDIEGMVEFHRWGEHTTLFSNDYYEYVMTGPGPRARDFARMYELFWPSFAKALREQETDATGTETGESGSQSTGS